MRDSQLENFRDEDEDEINKIIICEGSLEANPSVLIGSLLNWYFVSKATVVSHVILNEKVG